MNELYRHFLGRWQLIPESCQYEQGAPPIEGSYEIDASNGFLHFTICSRAKPVQGQTQKEICATFSARPDGSKSKTEGTLIDAMSLHAISIRELNTRAYVGDTVRMFAQQQLDESLSAMRVVQKVVFENESEEINIAVYKRAG